MENLDTTDNTSFKVITFYFFISIFIYLFFWFTLDINFRIFLLRCTFNKNYCKKRLKSKFLGKTIEIFRPLAKVFTHLLADNSPPRRRNQLIYFYLIFLIEGSISNVFWLFTIILGHNLQFKIKNWNFIDIMKSFFDG